MSSIETATRPVKFFYPDHPGDTVLVKQDPDYAKLANPTLAKDKYATFQMGYFETADLEVIDLLQSDLFRKKGIRCMDNPADIAEYGTRAEQMAWMNDEVERRVAEELEHAQATRAHSEASPFLPSPDKDAVSTPPSGADAY